MTIRFPVSARLPLIVLAAMLALLVGGIAKVEAVTYKFTKIADSVGPFGLNFSAPAINENGVVAFSVQLDSGVDSGVWGIFTGNGSGTTTLLDSSGPYSSFGPPSINKNGVVAALANFDPGLGGTAIVRTNGTTPVTIAQQSMGGIRTLRDPSINDSDVAAFLVFFSAGGSGILTGDGVATTIVARTPAFMSPSPYTSFGDAPIFAPFIADTGAVAFYAVDTVGNQGIFRHDGTTTTRMADTSGPLLSLRSPSLNNEGTVAFSATLDGGVTTGIFTSDGITTTLIVDNSGVFNSFNSPLSINDKGMVAFWATLKLASGGGAGIFTGPDPIADKVIAVGDDTLDESKIKITSLTLGREGLNNAGEIAFLATFENGTRGIYRAEPVLPEIPPEIPPEVPPELPSEIHVLLDIKPRSDRNTIKLRSHGKVRFAILSTATFDAKTVDPMTVTLAGAHVNVKKDGTPKVKYKDVDGDGRYDLVLRVSTPDLQLNASSTEAVLTGQTYDGMPITGADKVRIKYKIRVHSSKDKDKDRDDDDDDDD